MCNKYYNSLLHNKYLFLILQFNMINFYTQLQFGSLFFYISNNIYFIIHTSGEQLCYLMYAIILFMCNTINVYK